MSKSHQIIPTLCLVLTAVFSAPIWATDVVDLGSLDFPNSGSEEAQGPSSAASSCSTASSTTTPARLSGRPRRSTPDFALAYWGEAMTHNHPLWRRGRPRGGLEALGRLAPTPRGAAAKARPSASAATSKRSRRSTARATRRARSRLLGRHGPALGALPRRPRGQGFYCPLGPRNQQRECATSPPTCAPARSPRRCSPPTPAIPGRPLPDSLLRRPGPRPLGLRAARVYADIAPGRLARPAHDLAHLRGSGRWDESVESNVNAWEVSVDRAKKKSLDADAQNYHALYWLMYSYLQLGRYEDARAKLDMMAEFAEETKTDRSTWHYAAMRAAYVVETGARKLPTSIEPDSLSLSGAAKQYFADGLGALNSGDVDRARIALGAFEEAIESSSPGSLEKQVDWFSEVSDGTLADATVQLKSLAAMVALQEGKNDRAIQLLDEATAIESSRPLEYGPPSITQPSHELYGHVLSTLNKPGEAIEQYEIALQRAPRRSRSLAGLAEAAEAMGNTATREAACGELESIHASADESYEPPAACS